ncbi:hypothetical protein O7632_01095 [Solwaraspora sp. WMMD406]|uniref:hypothetical protein n=1 Tax=Solwaraspora sp. WMMD406 TaxID=3016095 RepID=UPI002417963A|nr:hypothetical protein [Solwaraspora sp. WMMD406]MDG4762718.1 hypothetical protein [Solwaraspora sp. WMMD406]
MAEIDYALRNKVDNLASLVVQTGQRVQDVSEQVDQVGAETRETRTELTLLRADFLAFIRQSELRDNVQLATSRIGIVQDQLDHEFRHHDQVRRSSVGMLQAFDVGLVSPESVQTIGEHLMIQTPRYWLAPVLVALAAWAGDDRELCDRAITEAFRRSADRTSLFMALVLRRQDRNPSAVRWLRHYLAAQDPSALGRDFAVILEAVAQGAFGPAGVDLVRTTIDGWQRKLLDDDAKQQAQVARWRFEVERYRSPSAVTRFPRLAKVSPQWLAMDSVLSSAGVHEALVTKYRALMAEETPRSDRLEDAVDDILDRLVGEYDTEELPLRRELAHHEAVVRNKGDLAAAQREHDSRSAALDAVQDFLTIQTTSALDPQAAGVSKATQQLSIAACHEWFGRAHASFTLDYRRSLPTDVQAVFEGDHNAGAIAFKLPRWTGSFQQPMETLEDSLSQHWDRHGKPFIDGFAFRAGGWYVMVAVAAAVVAAVFGGCTGSAAAALLSGVVAVGVGAAIVYGKADAAARRQQEARELVERARHDSIVQLRAAGAELVDWNTAFREADSGEQQVRAMIADFAAAGQASAPYERRVARPDAADDDQQTGR